MATLYQRVLGPSFTELAPILQSFHGSATGGRATGTVQVVHHSGILRKLLIWLLRLPPARDEVAVNLTVTCDESGERWQRWFDGARLETRQYQQGDLLIERVGLVRFGLTTKAVSGGMQMQTAQVWMLGLPLPRWLAPRVEAQIEPRQSGWAVIVRLALPAFGPLMQYHGEVAPLATA